MQDTGILSKRIGRTQNSREKKEEGQGKKRESLVDLALAPSTTATVHAHPLILPPHSSLFARALFSVALCLSSSTVVEVTDLEEERGRSGPLASKRACVDTKKREPLWPSKLEPLDCGESKRTSDSFVQRLRKERRSSGWHQRLQEREKRKKWPHLSHKKRGKNITHGNAVGEQRGRAFNIQLDYKTVVIAYCTVLHVPDMYVECRCILPLPPSSIHTENVRYYICTYSYY